MKLVIAFATDNTNILTFVSSNRDKVIPRNFRGDRYFCEKGINFSVVQMPITDQTNFASLSAWLKDRSRGAEGLILLIDEAHRHLAHELEDAYFVVGLQSYSGGVVQNQIHSAISPVLRHFAAYSQRFDDFGKKRVFLLPLDIFKSKELDELRDRLTNRKMEPGFGEDIERLLKELNKRARPKSQKRFKKVFHVDDRSLFYRYAEERHAIVQSAVPPHHEKCWHLSKFRFGRVYDTELHHNVDNDSEPTRVFGNFITCHGDVFTATGQSHLNIFPNGYI